MLTGGANFCILDTASVCESRLKVVSAGILWFFSRSLQSILEKKLGRAGIFTAPVLKLRPGGGQHGKNDGFLYSQG